MCCGSGGGGALVVGLGSGAVVGGGATIVGEGTSAGTVDVTGAGWAGMMSAGAGAWLLTAGAGVTPRGRGGRTCSGRAGPSVSPPAEAAGAVAVTAEPGRACTVPVSAVCHSHSATPVVATATAAVGANSHGDSSHPNRSRPGRLTRGGLTRGRLTRGRLTRGGLTLGRLTWGGPRAGRGRSGGEPVAERIRLAGRPRLAGIGIGPGHGRCRPEPHGSPPSNPRRACPGWVVVVVAVGAVGVQDGDGTHGQMTSLVCGTIHRRMPPDARGRLSPGEGCRSARGEQAGAGLVSRR